MKARTQFAEPWWDDWINPVVGVKLTDDPVRYNKKKSTMWWDRNYVDQKESV